MTHLIIENQNSNTEIVSVAIIQKLYEMALSAEGSVSLKGNLQSEHAKQGAYNYLNGNLTGTSTKRFPQLTINVTGGLYVDFADPVVEQKMITKFGDGVGVTASSVTGNLKESWGFRNNTSITSFDELGLFTNVTKFTNGEYVFLNCSNLQSIDLRNITEIGSSDSQAFRNCTSLTSVGNTSNLQVVGAGAFRECRSLSNIDLSNVTSIGQNAFSGCTSLTSIDLSNVTSLGRGAFLGCTSLSSVGQLNSNITSIPLACFKNCTSLTSIDLSNITSFPSDYDNGVFQGCTNLQNINIDFSNVTDTGSMTFYNCTSLGVNQDLVLYTNRADSSFYGTKYKSVVVHSSSTTRSMDFNHMPELLFLDYSDTQFTNVVDTYYSNKLNLMVLPPTITATLSWRFRADNKGLSKIILLATTPPGVESTSNWYMNGYATQNIVACDFYVPDNVLTTYQSASGWSGISTHIKPLSELPVGVWKTGLYQQYEPYLSNSSDPAYAIT